MTCLNQTGTVPNFEFGVHLCCKRVVLGDLISQLATDHESQMVKIFIYLHQAIGSISPQSQSQSRARSRSLACYVCTGLACVCDTINAGGVCGCLRRGTPSATHDCSFRRPPESGFSVVPTSCVVRLSNGNIHTHRRFFINPGLVRPSHARPRHVAPCNVRRGHVSRDLGLCLSVTASRLVLAL